MNSIIDYSKFTGEPCPFCGSDDVRIDGLTPADHACVTCNTCLAFGPPNEDCRDDDETIRLWNARSLDEEVVAAYVSRGIAVTWNIVALAMVVVVIIAILF